VQRESADSVAEVVQLPRREPLLTDVGNAERLVARHGADLRFVHPWSRWLVWDGRRWRSDDRGEATRRMKETLRAAFADANEIADDEERKRVVRHLLASEREPRVRGALALAQSEDGIAVLPEQLDESPWLLNVENGTLDLERGELREHDRADLMTKLAPVQYDPDAGCPVWLRFLERIFDGDEDLIAFVQRAIGYSLTGNTSEQVVFIAYGSGANGKSTLIETVRAMLGDYGQQTPAETFLERRETIPNDLARLRGARFVASVETPEGRRLNEVAVKRLVGGDTIAARFMRSEWFEFRPTFKAWLATNHRPVIRGTDEAIWRRIRLIPFAVTIPEQEREAALGLRLREELPGILRWALEGCSRWYESGLDTPEAVRSATDAYREDMDTLGQFVADCCVVHADAKAKASELYTRYEYWANANGERDRLTQQSFGRRLTERGFQQQRTKSARWWLGIGIRLDQEGDG
jgi:putative DNA primase/helicase